MKITNQNKSIITIVVTFCLILFITSCKKENSANTSTAAVTTVASALHAISVSTTASGDSVYVVGTCTNNHHLDSVSVSSLPATITDYLSVNYTGYTFQKTFTDNDESENIEGYVVIIQFNGNPVGLKFDASGNFVKVLEQREGRDFGGRGWHEGGRFNDRDGRHRDTVALTSLPATVTDYFASNYAQDTLVKAFKNRDSSYVVFSENNGAFATVFDANGTFIKRVQLHDDHPGEIAVVDQTALPGSALDYLSTTYPNYVFQQAFSISENGAVAGYAVGIDANGTKYAVGFDAAGNFIRAITIR